MAAAKRKAPVRRLPHGGARKSFRLPLLRRRRWHNHTGNQAVDPVEIRRARTVDDLVEAVIDAGRRGLTARCVGSGHSWSDVALTTGYLIPPHGLGGAPSPFARELARPDVDTDRLISVPSGARIRELNGWLAANDLALIQMGGYDGQTIAGVVSTSTHGSGFAFAPFPDYVRSVDLVDGEGVRRRIEPADGPTEPAAFAAARPGWQLTQRDEWFDAVVCGMGCMGLIVSLVLEVRGKFELTEVRTESDWATVRNQLLAGVWAEEDHYEVYVNPYARKGPRSNRCIVTVRTEGATGDSRHRPLIPELLGHVPWLTAAVVQLVQLLRPQLIPWLIDQALGAITCKGGYTNDSYRVYNIGSANNLRAYSAEMAVATKDDNHVAAFDRVLEVAEQYAREGAIYHTSFIALRFVARSRALMSMMHDRETMAMELIQLVDTDGGQEVVAAEEEALAPFAVRPHWGQINTLADRPDLAARYPGYADWERVRAQLDPKGVFASPFSKRVGITPRGFSS
jgi:FAD/FMN-containing dehydrogenase